MSWIRPWNGVLRPFQTGTLREIAFPPWPKDHAADGDNFHCTVRQIAARGIGAAPLPAAYFPINQGFAPTMIVASRVLSLLL